MLPKDIWITHGVANTVAIMSPGRQARVPKEWGFTKAVGAIPYSLNNLPLHIKGEAFGPSQFEEDLDDAQFEKDKNLFAEDLKTIAYLQSISKALRDQDISSQFKIILSHLA